MTTFKVKWEIDVEADTAREAAYAALQIQRDQHSIATVFEVRWGPLSQNVDLSEPGPVPAYFHDTVHTLEQAKLFLAQLHKEGKLFHLEDSPDTVIVSSTGVRLFTDEEAELLRERVYEVYDIFRRCDEQYAGDPLAFVMQELL